MEGTPQGAIMMEEAKSMRPSMSVMVGILIALFIPNSQPALAEIVTVEVEGIVDEVWADNGLTLDASVEIGTAMTGSCSYDTETVDLFPQFDHRGEYQLISISMSIGNYTFMNDPAFPDSALFEVSALGNFYHIASSYAPRFDGIVYIDGSPKTYDEVNFDDLTMALISLEANNDYGITDALPDSFMDLSVYRHRSFGVGSYVDHIGPGFYIRGELTSLTVTLTPEPATVLLLGLGGLALLRNRRFR